MVILGRRDQRGPTGRLGHYRAQDGSQGGAVELDLDRPHVAVVVGKRGAGKSYTLAVLAEELARTDGVAPVVVDPMGAFQTLNESPVGARVDRPTIAPDALDARAWCRLLDVDPASGAGALIWQAAAEHETLAAIRQRVETAAAPDTVRQAALNHLRLAASWRVFDDTGRDASDICATPSVLDLSGVDRAPTNAALAATADLLYEAREAGRLDRMPWLLVDEAHAFDGSVAGPSLERLLTRGRQPGVAVVLATQRPSALPSVATSQSDLLVTHRLTDRTDREALADARPGYVDGTLLERLPTVPGDALLVDDATESAHAIRVRQRDTPDGGASPRVSDGVHVARE